MTLRKLILEEIGYEYAHLKGKQLLGAYAAIHNNEGWKEGRSLKDNFFMGFHTEATIPLSAVCENLLPLLGNFSEDQKFKFEYGIKRAGDGIIKFVPLAERMSKEYKQPEDEVVTECYFKLEGYYKK